MKKIITILLCLILFVSCGIAVRSFVNDDGSSDNQGTIIPLNPFAPSNNNTQGSGAVTTIDNGEYLTMLENFELKVPTATAAVDNEEFEDFLDEMFRYYISLDFLNMHYSVVDYKSFNIEKPEVTLGNVTYGIDVDNYNKEVEFLNRLETFDFNSLSERQQADYESMRYSLYEDLASANFAKYSKVLSYDTCYPEIIFSNLCDYTFYDQESVEDYLTLLSDFDRFFKECVSYTDMQSTDGIYLLDEDVNYTIDAINGVLTSYDDNELITGFDSRIDELTFLSDSEKQDYKAKNKELVLNEVLPAYENILSEMNKYYGMASIEDAVLCNIDPDYARYNLMINTSSNLSAEEVENILLNAIYYFELVLYPYRIDDTKYNELMAIETDPNLPFTLSATDCLEFLRQNAYQYYPELGDVEYDAQVLNPDTAPDTVIAYNFPSPIDDSNQNIIRINPNNMSDGTAAYITLAHEGFPGHLFQHVYQLRNNANKIHGVIQFNGFVEGYAVYASRDAMLYSGVDQEMADAAFYMNEYYFLAYSLIDILTNSYGYTSDEIISYFNDKFMPIGITEYSIPYLREFMIEMPGVYQRYGVGFAQLFTYRMQAETILGDKFDPVTFNEMLIKDGDTPFSMVEYKFNKYIEENQ
ncbi:MAG: DUF885 family protein [Erysipelotrichaceae bacterium]|nr:DUF885 family protein [Erysipelotrichaceae bacterium]